MSGRTNVHMAMVARLLRRLMQLVSLPWLWEPGMCICARVKHRTNRLLGQNSIGETYSTSA